MTPAQESTYRHTRRTAYAYLAVMLGIVLVLALVHWLFDDLRAGRIWWFNLDKERNLPTWFSGVLLSLLGTAALVACYWERKHNDRHGPGFRLPFLWLGIGLGAYFMSLDEVTILHENLFWREVRHTSMELGDAWRYLTQWQLLFAPAIVVALGCFVVFFSNRLLVSPNARWMAFAGLGCWVLALFLESVRQPLKEGGKAWYRAGMISEELLEMAGTLALLAALVSYIIDIALDFSPERQRRLLLTRRFFTKTTTNALATGLVTVSLLGGIAYWLAEQLARVDAPLPRLTQKVLSEGTGTRDRRGELASHKVWFAGVSRASPITPRDKEALTRGLAAALLRGKTDATAIPAHLQADAAARIVFLSLSDGRSPAIVTIGSGEGIASALRQAVSDLRAWRPSGYRPRWLKVDFVDASEALRVIDPRVPLPLKRGLHGLAFDASTGIALLPEELLSHGLVSRTQRLRPQRIWKYLRTRSRARAPPLHFNAVRRLPAYRYTTSGFFADGERVLPLYRGHRRYDELTPQSLLAATRMAGEYLKTAVGADGRFVYAYLPKTDTTRSKYNILRHAGTTYAMLELYEATSDRGLLESAARAVDYLLSHIEPCEAPSGQQAACVREDDEVKLGGNALAVIALAKYTQVTGDHRHLPILFELARWIVAVQGEDGRFVVHKMVYPGGRVADFRSQYYPGEALLALSRTHALDGNALWLDRAERGARYLIEHRDGRTPESDLIHDHWLLYTLDELYRQRPDPQYLSHARQIARAIMNKQNHAPPYPDWRGSYYRPPRSTPTATRSEGLCAAYRLVRDFGSAEEAAGIRKAIEAGIRFQLQTQFRPESVMYLLDPPRALGGFHRSLTNFEIRIDYVQHNISSLLGLYRIMTGS